MPDIEFGSTSLDVLPDPHVVIDAAGALLAANQVFDRRLLAEPRAVAHVATAAEQRLDVAADIEGRRRVYSVSWMPCRWHGTPARLVRFLDVTDERRHSEALERGVHALEDAIDALTASLLIVDARGVILSANARWHVSARAHGLAFDNAGIGSDYLAVCVWSSVRDEAEAARVADGLHAVLERRALAFETEVQLSMGSGAPQWYRLSITALGAHPGAVIQLYDTTETHRQQQETIEALAHFKAVFDGALDGIIIYDDAMGLLRGNLAADALVGGVLQGGARRTLLDLVVPDDHESLLQSHNELLVSGSSRGTLRLRPGTSEGRIIEYASRANVVPGRHVAVIRDVTTARLLETQLRQSQKMEALGQLTGGIAHDFNNLLTIIHAQSDLLLTEPTLPADLREGVSQVLRASQRGADMVRKLMAFGRREQLRVEPTQLVTAVQETIGILQRVLPETVLVHFTAAGEVPEVLADSTAVQQILLNLATNARDAMRAHGGDLRVHMERADAHAHLSVSDTGCGMNSLVLSRIFEPFFTTKPAGEGTGLGMSMVYGLMHQMGGDVRVESREGKGTVVLLRFLLAAEAQSSPVASLTSPHDGCRGSERVLLVEDDDAIRAVTARVLRRAGYDVTEAVSGDDAAEHLAARMDVPDRSFSLVVSDVVMPHGDGYRVLDATRRYAAPRIVWVTGYAGGGFGQGPVHAPCDAPIIQKPWTTTDFLARIRTVLDAPPNVPLDATDTHAPSRPRQRRE